jgi:hypothetical protein
MITAQARKADRAIISYLFASPVDSLLDSSDFD